ncbi:hypothetical protein GCL60_02680 [Silvanigrella paludirubra]|uniref:Uncharacterized protein n=1 Tax=Silvanigrella paludirubra TaxID=2499159 RepID=A0A6N6VX09_9BACT|nr:hypothetical protein [Silvanigrella paludirubra]KAB8040851.1 hypothetical protein GCL60_02680 [Silvanigrella paludirubra]
MFGIFNYTYYFQQSTSNYFVSLFHLYLYGLTFEKNFENIGFSLEVDYSIAKQSTTQKQQSLDILIGLLIYLK